MPIVYLPHGGGPLPLLGDPAHAPLVKALQGLARQLPRPASILVLSAHWEAPVPTLTAAEQPGLIYDYGGFPPESYRICYPAPGAPGQAASIASGLRRQGLNAQLDTTRGWDHGVFVPLKLMYPEARIPVVECALLASLKAEQHLQLGEALRSVVPEDMLVIGSGFSFHNLRAFFQVKADGTCERNQQFETWLAATLTDTRLSETERRQRLARWSEAPAARFCHPREEHLLPLHVCYGLAGRAADHHEQVSVGGIVSSLVIWQ